MARATSQRDIHRHVAHRMTLCFLHKFPALDTVLFCERLFQERQGVPARCGARLVVFPRPNRPQFQEATTQAPSRAGTPCPLPVPKEVQGGRWSRPEGGGVPRRGEGSRLMVFFGLYRIKNRGNTTSRVPQQAGTPRIFPVFAQEKRESRLSLSARNSLINLVRRRLVN